MEHSQIPLADIAAAQAVNPLFTLDCGHKQRTLMRLQRIYAAKLAQIEAFHPFFDEGQPNITLSRAPQELALRLPGCPPISKIYRALRDGLADKLRDLKKPIVATLFNIERDERGTNKINTARPHTWQPNMLCAHRRSPPWRCWCRLVLILSPLMLRSVGSFSKTVGRRLRNAGGYVPGQRIVTLADCQKFWATRVPRGEWADLQPGDELLPVRAKHAHVPFPACIEMATVLGNHAGTEALALAWGLCAERPVDNRPAMVLYYLELEAILRYELRETGCSDVVFTIIPNPN